MIPPCVQMYILDDKQQIKYWARWIVYFLAASFVSVALGNNAVDDGLRHIAFSQYKDIMHSWGEVFPFSLFGEYDPWSFWDHFLTYIVQMSSYENANILVNLISIFILLILIDIILNIEFKKYKNIIMSISLLVLIHVFYRYINVRPDLMSGFYIMITYIIIRKYTGTMQSLALALVTILYIPVYYLFFVYTLALTMYMFLLGNYRNMFMMLALSAAGIFFYYFYFGKESLEIIGYVLKDESLRDGMLVEEGQPLFNIILLINTKILFFIYIIVVLYVKYKYSAFLKENPLLTLILTLSLLWVGQMRYYNLFLPLFYVYAISLVVNIDMKTAKQYLQKLLRFIYVFRKQMFKNNKNISFMIILSLFFAFEIGLVVKNDLIDVSENKKFLMKEFSSDEYNNSVILFNSLNSPLYYSIYANPTVKTIPSCSVGWDNGDENFHVLYRNMLQKKITFKELHDLAKKVNADFLFLEMPINKNDGLNSSDFNKYFVILKFYGKYLILKAK